LEHKEVPGKGPTRECSKDQQKGTSSTEKKKHEASERGGVRKKFSGGSGELFLTQKNKERGRMEKKTASICWKNEKGDKTQL